MDESWLTLCEDHNIKVWYEEDKKRWCLEGQSLAIANCLRATKAQNIIVDGQLYDIDDVIMQIYQLSEIKLAFQQLIF